MLGRPGRRSPQDKISRGCNMTGGVLAALLKSGGSSIISSVQQISITIGGSSNSNTTTITSVDTSRSMVLWNGFTTDAQADDAGNKFGNNIVSGYLTLTNSTTVTATRGGNDGAKTVTLYGTVIEFAASAVTSIQRGTIAIGSGSTTNTATLSSITTSRSVVFHTGYTISGSGGPGELPGLLIISSSTQLTAQRGVSSSLTVTVGYAVVEFAATVIENVQVITGNPTDRTAILAISSVDTSRSMVLWNGFIWNFVGAAAMDFFYTATLSSSTAVTLANNTSSGPLLGGTVTVQLTVVQFKAGIVKSAQRSVPLINSVEDYDGLTTVNLSKSVANWLGVGSSDNTIGSSRELFTANYIFDANTIINFRGASGDQLKVSWEVIEFN
jgi:hypothetical protein